MVAASDTQGGALSRRRTKQSHACRRQAQKWWSVVHEPPRGGHYTEPGGKISPAHKKLYLRWDIWFYVVASGCQVRGGPEVEHDALLPREPITGNECIDTTALTVAARLFTPSDIRCVVEGDVRRALGHSDEQNAPTLDTGKLLARVGELSNGGRRRNPRTSTILTVPLSCRLSGHANGQGTCTPGRGPRGLRSNGWQCLQVPEPRQGPQGC